MKTISTFSASKFKGNRLLILFSLLTTVIIFDVKVNAKDSNSSHHPLSRVAGVSIYNPTKDFEVLSAPELEGSHYTEREITTWNGGVWSNGIPTASKTAIIAGDYFSAYEGAGDISAFDLTVTSGAAVVISSGFSVTLIENLTVDTGSSFTLENNANLVQTAEVSNTGNIIVKRNTAALIRQDYVLWSSPVQNQKLLSFSPATLTNRFYTYDSATDKYVVVASPSTTDFEIGSGYLIRVPNTHPTTPTILGAQFSGIPNNGTINIAVANSTYNAIGNPYPSTLSADSFINENGIDEALYFWRKTNNSNNSSYATYTLAGGVSNFGGDPLLSTPDGSIAVGQGFIAKSTGTVISFTNVMRTAAASAPFLRLTNQKNRFWLNLLSSSGVFFQTMVSYMPIATSGIDKSIDGRFLNDTQSALTSLIDNQEFTIQGRALPFKQNDKITLGFKAKVAETYTITLGNFDGLFASNQDIYVKDNLTNTLHNLKLAPYTFNSDAGTFNTRFEIVYQNTLAVQQAVGTENNLEVYKENQEIIIKSGNTMLSAINVYDLRGRLLKSITAINASQMKFFMGTASEVLILKMSTNTGEIITKKLIY